MIDKFQSLCILVYYPVAAGGKFIINSLGLSRHCVPHSIKYADWDIQQNNFNSAYYNTKLQQILETIPPINDYLAWQSYELGVGMQWYPTYRDPSPVKKIIDANRHFCIIVHDPENLKLRLLETGPVQHMVKLTNYIEWLKISKFKHPSVIDDITNKVAYWNYIDKQELNTLDFSYMLVDMDTNIFDQNAMANQIKNLYSKLQFDDFNFDLWRQYYNKYINFHKVLYEIQNNQT